MSLSFITAQLRCDAFTLVFEVEEFSRALLEPGAVSFYVYCRCTLQSPGARLSTQGENLPIEIGEWIQSLRAAYDAGAGRVEFTPEERWIELGVAFDPGPFGTARVSGRIGGLFREDPISVTIRSSCTQDALGTFVRELEAALI